MSDSNVENNNDDLNVFEAEFFGTEKPKAPELEAVEVVEGTDPEPDDEEIDDESVEVAEDSSDEQEDDESPRPEKKNRKTASERIQELNTKFREAERRALEAERRAAAAEEAGKKPKEEPRVQAPAQEDGPNPDEKDKDGNDKYPLGEFDPAYIRDLTRHTIKQEQAIAEAYRKEREQQEAVTRAREEAQTVWQEKLSNAKKEIPDIEEAIIDLAETFNTIDDRYSQYLVDVVMTLDNGPAVLKYLSDNPKTAREIVNSGAATATVKLGRLDAMVAKPTQKDAAKKVTRAPTPAPRTTRGTSGSFAVMADTDDLDAFESVFFPKRK